MLPMQKQQGVMLPVFPGRPSHSAHQGLVSGRERGGIPIHRGEVLTSVEGSSSFLAAATKFSMNQALGTHHSLAVPQLLIREQTFQCLGAPMAAGAWRGVLAMTGSVSKTPWVPDSESTERP